MQVHKQLSIVPCCSASGAYAFALASGPSQDLCASLSPSASWRALVITPPTAPGPSTHMMSAISTSMGSLGSQMYSKALLSSACDSAMSRGRVCTASIKGNQGLLCSCSGKDSQGK